MRLKRQWTKRPLHKMLPASLAGAASAAIDSNEISPMEDLEDTLARSNRFERVQETSETWPEHGNRHKMIAKPRPQRGPVLSLLQDCGPGARGDALRQILAPSDHIRPYPTCVHRSCIDHV